MPTDRSDEIRVLVLKQRIDKFMKYITDKAAEIQCQLPKLPWVKGWWVLSPELN
jgi:hypothetical protein